SETRRPPPKRSTLCLKPFRPPWRRATRSPSPDSVFSKNQSVPPAQLATPPPAPPSTSPRASSRSSVPAPISRRWSTGKRSNLTVRRCRSSYARALDEVPGICVFGTLRVPQEPIQQRTRPRPHTQSSSHAKILRGVHVPAHRPRARHGQFTSAQGQVTVARWPLEGGGEGRPLPGGQQGRTDTGGIGQVRQRMRRGRPQHTGQLRGAQRDRKSTRLNSSHVSISYAVFCLKKKKTY